jgi:hypothetical protein
VASLTSRVQRVAEDYHGTPREKRDYFRAHFPPLVAAYQAHRGNDETTSALDAELLQHFTRQNGGRADVAGEYQTEYLLVIARK